MDLEKQVKEVLKQILLVESDTGFLPYAKGYSRKALSMTGEALRIQVIYVLNNLQYWRGKEARAAKKILKSFIKDTRREDRLI